MLRPQGKGIKFQLLTKSLLTTSAKYSWLPITWTCPNSNQSRFPLDFLLTFTVILPLITQTLDNSNLPLTRSNFCFPSAHFNTILPVQCNNSNHVISTWQVGKKKRVLKIRNIEFISKQPSKFFVFTFLSLQFKFSVLTSILCCLIAFPSHPIAYFLASSCLLQTPDDSNFFRFPLKAWVIGSRLYLKTKNCQDTQDWSS